MKIHRFPDNQHISEPAGCGLQTLKAGNEVQTVEIINKHSYVENFVMKNTAEEGERIRCHVGKC